MKIIPVIDLMHGQVVHARHGRREHYRPLQSLLCRGSEPKAVIDGLLGLYPFDTLYIADLDALLGKGRQTEVLNRLRQSFPELAFWVDQGLADREEWSRPPADDQTVTVMGSESLAADWQAVLADSRRSFVLSLDFHGETMLGPPRLAERPDLWPERVILMELARVGGTEGPGFRRAERFQRAYPGHRFIAAGGVRGEDDLERLAAIGLDAVLLASSLHSGMVNARALERFGQERGP